ncbi:MAG TPA: RNA methyltransferase [Microvirga sp.]|nr:RNA methyltransferase [Microvirga sp.]
MADRSASTETLVIDRLGAKSDGIADTPRGPVFVAGALPGERVAVTREGARAHLVAVETASPERETPFCPYFHACGGCATQHMSHGLYQGWKRDIVVGALRQARLEVEVAPLVDAHGEGRRRITLHARYQNREVEVGYMAARSHHLVPIAFCPIAEPALKESAPAVAKALASRLKGSGKPLDIQVTASAAGLDVDIRGHGPLKDQDRLSLVETARELGLARLSLHGDVIVELQPPAQIMGRAAVVPPPGSFLQATRLGEETLAGLVLDACAGAKRVADLFAGCGPFSLRLAERAEVHAVETDKGSLFALDRAARGTPGLRRIATEARDLFRRPLLTPELKGFDAVVIDPPRAGAEAQVRQLALSEVPVIASVSCDPGTFARDAEILIAAGYRLERVVPVDQFKHSPHVELVGVLRRDAKKRRGRP